MPIDAIADFMHYTEPGLQYATRHDVLTVMYLLQKLYVPSILLLSFARFGLNHVLYPTQPPIYVCSIRYIM